MAPRKHSVLEKLIKSREMAFANIQRIADIIEQNGDSLSVENLQCRLQIVEKYFEEWLKCQCDIEQSDHEIENASAVDLRGEVEDLFCAVKSKTMYFISEQSLSSKQPTHGKLEADHLPKIKLPTFSGKYAEYTNFIHLFKTLVGNSSKLTDIEKFNHLLSCLSDGALRAVKALDLTAENYEKALSLLEGRKVVDFHTNDGQK